MTLAGIEPATFRFVAQHLNHCATAVPHVLSTLQTNYAFMYSAAVHFDQTAAAAQRHKHQTVFCLFWSSQAEQTELLQQQKFLRFLCLAPSTSFHVYLLPTLYCSAVRPPTQNTVTPPTDVQVSGNTD